MLRVSIFGSRKVIYDNTVKANARLNITDPAVNYQQVKDRLLLFTSNTTEKMMHAKQQWQLLSKTSKISAQQFEAAWAHALADLRDANLCPEELDLYVTYLQKVGPELNELIRRGKRQRPDGKGENKKI